jgi:hypothetical protein
MTPPQQRLESVEHAGVQRNDRVAGEEGSPRFGNAVAPAVARAPSGSASVRRRALQVAGSPAAFENDGLVRLESGKRDLAEPVVVGTRAG